MKEVYWENVFMNNQVVNPVFPRMLTHEGLVMAKGFYIDINLLGEVEAKKRVLDLWQSGTQVFQWKQGWLLKLPQALSVHSQQSLGTPLVEVQRNPQVLSSVPLDEDEKQALGIIANPTSVELLSTSEKAQSVVILEPAIILMQAGQADVVFWKQLVLEDIVAWFFPWFTNSLADSPLSFQDFIPFQEEIKVLALEEAAKPIGEDVRKKLGIPAANPTLWQSLVEPKPDSTNKIKGSKVDSSQSQGTSSTSTLFWVGAMMTTLFTGLLWPLIKMLQRGGFSGSSGSVGSSDSSDLSKTSPSSSDAFSQKSKVPAWFLRMQSFFRKLSARFLEQSRLSRLLNRRQAAFVQKMMDLFESGNLDEALRHAIPLANQENANNQDESPSFGVPKPRDQLHISALSQSRVSAFSSPVLFEELKKVYEQAFAKLKREGHIEKAAFVLAELLGKSEEAVSFLEQEKKYELAAQVAELRNLAPGLMVRQWLLAKNLSRALILAKRHHAFADAVFRLESTHPEEAKQLRFVWAENLIQAGQDLAAIEVLAKIKEAKEQILTLINQAFAAEDALVARLLVKKIELFPETFSQEKNRFLSLLERGDSENAPSESFHELLENLLLQVRTTTENDVEIRALAKILVKDWFQKTTSYGLPPLSKNHPLVKLAGDPIFRIDIPKVIPVSDTRSISSAVDSSYDDLDPSAFGKVNQIGGLKGWTIQAKDQGTLCIYDQVILPNGKMLVALGEAGVWLLNQRGQKIHHFDQPAHHLVLSDPGYHALLLAKRGQHYRISRLDVKQKKAVFWTEMKLSVWTKDYDGSLWFVGVENQILLVDAQSKTGEALWKVGELTGQVKALERSATSLSIFLLGTSISPAKSWGQKPKLELVKEIWQYELPKLILRKRYEMRNKEGSVVGLSANGTVALLIEGVSSRDTPIMIVLESPSYGLRGYSFPGFDKQVDPVLSDKELTQTLLEPKQNLDDTEVIKIFLASNTENIVSLKTPDKDEWLVLTKKQQDSVHIYLFETKSSLPISITFQKSQQVQIHSQGKFISLGDDRGRLLVYDVDAKKLVRNLRIT